MDEDRVQPFATEVLRRDGVVVIVVRGEIDVSTAPEFRAAIESAVDGSGRFEVDLRETSFMDSAGLAVLIDARRRLDEVHEMLLVRDPQPPVRRVLAVSGVDALIDIRCSGDPDSEDAGSIGR